MTKMITGISKNDTGLKENRATIYYLTHDWYFVLITITNLLLDAKMSRKDRNRIFAQRSRLNQKIKSKEEQGKLQALIERNEELKLSFKEMTSNVADVKQNLIELMQHQ